MYRVFVGGMVFMGQLFLHGISAESCSSEVHVLITLQHKTSGKYALFSVDFAL